LWYINREFIIIVIDVGFPGNESATPDGRADVSLLDLLAESLILWVP
jgi:hypothetical protein